MSCQQSLSNGSHVDFTVIEREGKEQKKGELEKLWCINLLFKVKISMYFHYVLLLKLQVLQVWQVMVI